jgi:ABC-type phosphate transport system auxiliary subunit
MTNEEIIAMQLEEIELMRIQLRLQRALEDEYKAEISVLQNELEELQSELDSFKDRVIDLYDTDTRRPWES